MPAIPEIDASSPRESSVPSAWSTPRHARVPAVISRPILYNMYTFQSFLGGKTELPVEQQDQKEKHAGQEEAGVDERRRGAAGEAAELGELAIKTPPIIARTA